MLSSTDIRNANFEQLHGSLEGQRRDAYDAWLRFGPGTTRQIAQKSGIDLLTFRPRTTELLQLGLLSIVVAEDGKAENGGIPGRAREGIYQTTDRDTWNRWRDAQISQQQQLI